MAGSSDLVKLSKSLSYILRHGAEKEGIALDAQGFASVDDLLKLPQLRRFTLANIELAVSSNEKQRFTLKRSDSGKMLIRATQGHSIQLEQPDIRPVLDSTQYPVVVHGTQWRLWPTIQREGLSRMSRTHIHFAQGLPGEAGVISGMRQSCNLLIFVDLTKAISAGLQFFVSANGVLLCAGDQRGYLGPQFFAKVVRRHPDGSEEDILL